jgi:hypothetical protein
MTDERTGRPAEEENVAVENESGHEKPERQETAADSDPRTTIGGRYSVDLRATPRGDGIAVAYPGRDLRTRDAVTVKTLRLEYREDPEMRARFRREARLLQFLSHPNVIRALTFTEERGAPWLVLEFVKGPSLRDEIAREAPYTPEAVVPMLNGLASALDHLHARGLVHLDVRPENAVVTPEGDLKLVDFGLAQAAGSDQETADSAGEEGAAYLAPEQVCGEPVGVATDVFALGCIVYELLTGKPPFPVAGQGADRNTAIRSRLEEKPVPLTRAAGHVALPAWVDGVVMGALERDPRQRYSSAGSFAVVFRAGVEGEVDVESGRPRFSSEVPRGRQVPINEPGIAVKGAPRLAARRAAASVATGTDGADVVDATFAPVADREPATPAAGASRRDLDRAGRRLWQAVIVAAALNIILVIALVVTRGEIPGIWSAGGEIGPGSVVRVAGTGLVARAAPENDGAIVVDLPEGGMIRISGQAVESDDGIWWPVEVETASGAVSGYVPQSWVQTP